MTGHMDEDIMCVGAAVFIEKIRDRRFHGDSFLFYIFYVLRFKEFAGADLYFCLLAAPAKESGVRGRETSAFEMVLSPEAKQDKFMAALRWFLPRENS